MKTTLRILGLTLFLTSLTLVSWGQCTSAPTPVTLTGITTDSDSQAWVNAAWVATLSVPGGGVPVDAHTGQTVCSQVTGRLNTSGSWNSATIERTDAILPFGATWSFSIYSVTSAPPSILNNVTFTVSSFNMGTYTSPGGIQPVTAPRFQAIPGSFGYIAAEAQPIPCGNGNQWFDILTSTQLFCNGGSYVPPVAACTVMSTSTLGCAKIDGTTTTLNGSNQLVAAPTSATLAPVLGTTLVGDGYIVVEPSTPDASHVTLTHAKLAQLDTSNTFSQGPQTLQSGSPTKVALVVNGNGTVTAGVAFLAANTGTSVGPFAVSVGQMILATTQGGSPCRGAPTDSLLNTFTEYVPARITNTFNTCTYYSIITNPGSDTLNLTNTHNFAWALLFSSVNTSTPFDTVNTQTFSSTGTLAFSLAVTPSVSNDLMVSIGTLEAGAACTPPWSVPAGFTSLSSAVSPAPAYGMSTLLNSGTSPVSVSFGVGPGCNTGNEAYGWLFAIEPGSSFVQGVDLAQNTNASNTVLSGTDKIGRNYFAVHAGTPTDTPTTNPATGNPENVTSYDTSGNQVDYYNQAHGWIPFLDSANATTVLAGDFAAANSTQGQILTGGSICTTGNAAYNICGTPMTVTIAHPFTSTNYTIHCFANTPTSAGSTSTATFYWVAGTKTTSGFSLQMQNGDTTSADATTVSEIDCTETFVGP